jgi:putative CocE/NonD family hydrolase
MQHLNDLYSRAPEKKYKGIVTQSHYLTMRDGTQIAVDVLLPFDLEPGMRLPVVLTMTRYWRSFELRGSEPQKRAPIAPRESLADDLVLRGFAMIVVDARGSGASTGVSRHPWTTEEIADYGQVADWAVAQPWCNGNIGAVGNSYEGTTALLLTTTGKQAVKGVVPQQFEFDVYADIAFPGGIFNAAFIDAWSMGSCLWYTGSARSSRKTFSKLKGAEKWNRIRARDKTLVRPRITRGQGWLSGPPSA